MFSGGKEKGVLKKNELSKLQKIGKLMTDRFATKTKVIFYINPFQVMLPFYTP